ncbi:MAG: glycosyltransferase family 4 protein [Chloroflexota bacterium]
MENKRVERLRIAMIAPPFLPVPPPRYGGTERIVGVLSEGLQERGHDVTVFASGDSRVKATLVPVVPEALWKNGAQADIAPHMERIVAQVESYDAQFDVIHSHLESHAFAFARRSSTPVVSTLHGRIDIGPTAEALASYPDIALIAISDKQRSFWPDHNWLATIHHGLPFDDTVLGTGAGGYLLFVGRLTPEKGLDLGVELARRAGLPLLVAAKAIDAHEIENYHAVVEPAERAGIATFVGEVGPPARDELLADALATVMLGDWPEPFGLVAVESLATGTPVIARRAGALPEIVRHGIDGFVVDNVEEALAAIPLLVGLDRARIRTEALSRFSADRMVDQYETLFRDLTRSGPGEPGVGKPQLVFGGSR